MSKSGRPKGESDVCARLIEAARDLFTRIPYDKVTTRQLAEHAGVNIAMIRYYFGNKSGLFSEMLREVIAPVKKQVSQAVMDSNASNFTAILSAYYQAMGPNPTLPQLIFQIIAMPDDAEPRKILSELFPEKKDMPDKLFSALDSGSLKEGVNPVMAWLSLQSLMVFPFLLYPHAQREGVEIATPEFLEELAKHNAQLLSEGIFKDKE